MDLEYGGIDAYLEHIGLAEAELAAFRQEFVVPAAVVGACDRSD